MILEMFTSVANPKFVAPMGIVDAPADIGRELLKRRDAFGKPVCAVVSDPAIARRAKPVHICNDDDAWEVSE